MSTILQRKETDFKHDKQRNHERTATNTHPNEPTPQTGGEKRRDAEFNTYMGGTVDSMFNHL